MKTIDDIRSKVKIARESKHFVVLDVAEADMLLRLADAGLGTVTEGRINLCTKCGEEFVNEWNGRMR